MNVEVDTVVIDPRESVRTDEQVSGFRARYGEAVGYGRTFPDALRALANDHERRSMAYEQTEYHT